MIDYTSEIGALTIASVIRKFWHLRNAAPTVSVKLHPTTPTGLHHLCPFIVRSDIAKLHAFRTAQILTPRQRGFVRD